MKNLIITAAILTALYTTINVNAQTSASNVNAVNVSIENEDGSISLKWKTNREINTSYFITERSTDGINFTPFATKAAASSSVFPRSYTMEDISENNSLVYYRVVLVLMNGERVTSSSVAYHLNDADTTAKNIAQK